MSNLTSQPFYCHPQLFTTPAPIMKELPDCGKRYIRTADEPKFGECFWNCEVGVIIINCYQGLDLSRSRSIIHEDYKYTMMMKTPFKWSVHNPYFNYFEPEIFFVNNDNKDPNSRPIETYLPNDYVKYMTTTFGSVGFAGNG